MSAYDPVAIARQFLFVREAQSLGQNEGQRVNAIQVWSLGQAGLGTSWCAEFVTMVLDICYQGDAPIPRGGSCEDIRRLASANGWLSDSPTVGGLVLSLQENGVAHHIGIVTSLDPLSSVAGNTSDDGTSSNGDRVAEHVITSTAKAFVRIPE